MTPDPQLAKSIFLAALEEAAEERSAFLAEACAGNPDLCMRVERLLSAHDRPDSMPAGPAIPGPTHEHREPQRASAAITEGPGTVIGPYKLLQQIGEGGMGTVYMAEQQQPVRRRVALKIIKPGMDSAQVVARFEAERQALALMDHQNIARVLDGGTTATGRPYFVMELVKGVAITEYCDQNQLTPRERLELFIPVCQAVQHAHQKGIIHRDVKPSNVMVTLYDGKPVPKVIDFGVAKAIDQRLTERTLFTAYGQVVGTLEYMSPEQAALSGLDMDTRSDIYSLGVLAYELLTGTTPLQRKALRSAAYDEILRLIREQEPPKPSTRLSDSGAGLATISAQRKTEPTKLTRLVRGDLDWIVMKALEKDRGRRYETANALARDVERYLADEPVEACPPSAGYRTGKFLRRHKGPVLAATLVLLALVAGIIGTSWGLVWADWARQAEANQRLIAQTKEAEAVADRAAAVTAAEQQRKAKIEEAHQRQRAVAEKQIAEAVRRFLQHDLLRQADVIEQANAVRRLGGEFETAENPTIKDLLDRAAAELTPAKIEAKFPGQKEVQASILWTVGDAYRGVGDYSKAAEFLTRASGIYRDTFGPDHPNTLYTVHNLATAYCGVGKLTEAIELFEHVRDAYAKNFGADDPKTLATVNSLAGTYQAVGKLALAIDQFEHVHAAYVKKFGADGPQTLTALNNLAGAYQAAGKLSLAIELFEQVRDADVKKFGADDPQTLTALNNLATAYQAVGKLPQAIELLEQVRDADVKKFGTDHPQTLGTLHNLAAAYLAAGKLPQAIELLEQVRDARVKKLGADHPHTLSTLHILAAAYYAAGKLPQAIELFQQVRDLQVKKLGGDHPDTLATLNSLALSYRAAGKLPQAIALYEQARDAQVKKLGADHPLTLATLHGLAQSYQAVGKLPQAIELLEQVRDAQVKKLGADHPHTLNTQNDLAMAYQAVGKLPQAVELFQQVYDAKVKKLGADHPHTLVTLNNLAFAFQTAGKLPQAIELFQQVYDAQVKTLGANHPNAVLVLNNLAKAYEEAGKPEQALPLFRQAALETEKRKFDFQNAGRIVVNVITCHEQLRQFPEAEVWRRKWLAVVKERAGVDSAAYAGEQSALGANLLKQKKYAEAEPLLLAGADGLLANEKTVPPKARGVIADAIQRLIDLYDATDKKDDAEKWRQRLAERKKTKSPTDP